MQYNEDLYNSSNYNVGVLALALFESMTASDNRTLSDSQALNELVTLVDVLQKFFGGQILVETATLSDVQLKTYFAEKLDILSLTDARVATVLKTFLETLTLADVRTLALSVQLGDFTILLDDLTKQITDKRLTEGFRLQDWLSTKKRPAENIWSA